MASIISLFVFHFNDVVYTSYFSSASGPQLLFILRLCVKRDYPPATCRDDTLAVLIHAWLTGLLKVLGHFSFTSLLKVPTLIHHLAVIPT